MSGLRVQGISRSFGSHQVLRDVDLAVARGEIVGFVGGNGAGKTTTMRLILGLLEADHGDITWDGQPITAQHRRRIGYMPEERGLYPQMQVREQIIHFALLEGHSLPAARTVTDSLIAALGLAGRERALLQDLSLGNQQRVQLAAALVGDPDMLVLDEPFSGLDPLAVETMAQLIREQAARGVGVLFSSHQLELVERLCDRVCVLDHGRVAASGRLADLRAEEHTRWSLHLEGAASALAAMLAEHGDVQSVSETELTLTVPGANRSVPHAALQIIAAHGRLRSIELVQRSLTQILSDQFISQGRTTAPAAPIRTQAGAQ